MPILQPALDEGGIDGTDLRIFDGDISGQEDGFEIASELGGAFGAQLGDDLFALRVLRRAILGDDEGAGVAIVRHQVAGELSSQIIRLRGDGG